ncbi:Uncharacterised protein [Klebsiella michiganensis]|nr:Uncharacterised protein [Klebsiella michiganensis]
MRAVSGPPYISVFLNCPPKVGHQLSKVHFYVTLTPNMIQS